MADPAEATEKINGERLFSSRIALCTPGPGFGHAFPLLLARFAGRDQEDIKALAAEGLLSSKDLKKRAQEALKHYIGNPGPIKASITLACKMVGKSQLR